MDSNEDWKAIRRAKRQLDQQDFLIAALRTQLDALTREQEADKKTLSYFKVVLVPLIALEGVLVLYQLFFK